MVQYVKDPTTSGVDLCVALFALGEALRVAGCLDGAFHIHEAVIQLCRQLAAKDPGTSKDLAAALNNLGTVAEAVGRFRKLAETNPGPVIMHGLATSLYSVGAHLRAVGRNTDALRVGQEAVDLRQTPILPRWAPVRARTYSYVLTLVVRKMQHKQRHNLWISPMDPTEPPLTYHIREFVEGSSCNKVTINVTVHVEFVEGSSCNKVTINLALHIEFVEGSSCNKVTIKIV
ncbi:hypothetical protein K438DRAFT_1776690 [Mycena galopus ATCC 62051]|nr:hypothetical protein K438DRAFT_1776690 [Mycena galopus ATCC 62051]